MQATRFANRHETRIPVSRATQMALKKQLREGEAYDTCIRRMLVSGEPRLMDELSPKERAWVVNEYGVETLIYG